ncbi:MAG: site-specific integrase [Proteobacteria bacterium]|nr:site-specific integrase [Pseudomonadota bacterium]
MSLRFTRLTRPAIRKLQPGKRITEHGITAEGLPDGDIRYTIAVMVDGQRIHRVIGRASDGTTRTQAEDFIAKTRADAKEGRLNLPRGRKVHLTFAKAAKLYLQREKEAGGKDLVSKERHLRLHLVPYFGAMRVDRISTFTVEKFRNSLRKQGLAEGNINRILATYRRMGRRLARWEVIPTPLPMIELKRADDHRERVLSVAEEGVLLDAALADSNPYVWLFIKIGLATSLRHSEILSARFDRLDPQRKRLRVQVKGGKWRKQPLSEEITEILLRERDMAQDPEGWIFPSPNSASGHIDRMKKAFRRCVIRAGLDPSEVIPHTLRHSAITNLAETGADVKTIQEFSGHETLEMVFRYTHARDQRVDNAVEMMERAKTNVEHLDRSKHEKS